MDYPLSDTVLTAPDGVEPSPSESESGVLPINESAISSRYYNVIDSNSKKRGECEQSVRARKNLASYISIDQ